MPGGRPTKYKARFCEDVILMGKDGKSLHEMARELDICFDTLNEWRKAKPEFSVSIKKAVALSQGWWEELGRKGAKNGDINPTVWIFNMKNRFRDDWRDKQEVEQSGTISVVRLKPRYKLKEE